MTLTDEQREYIQTKINRGDKLWRADELEMVDEVDPDFFERDVLRRFESLTFLERQGTIAINQREWKTRRGKITRELRRYREAKCPYCGTGGVLGVDHIIPISRGGDNSWDNLQLICVSCNSQKRDKTHSEYVAWLTDRNEKCNKRPVKEMPTPLSIKTGFRVERLVDGVSKLNYCINTYDPIKK